MSIDKKVSKKTSTTYLASQHDPAAYPLEDVGHRAEESLVMLAHEMRNPLSALSYALEVWEQKQDDLAQIEELRNVMKRQVSQLMRLSDNLLDAERITQGKLKLRQERIELRQLVNDACEQVRPFVDHCGHALTVRLPSAPIMVYGDPSRLLQVFANLLQNAAKFTGRNGTLCITGESRDGFAVVRVRDNGPGIEKQMISKIFDSHTQSNGTCGRENDGLGIGLRLVKTIVELHGGSVVANSAGRGRGSEFTVMLPKSNDIDHDHRPTTQGTAAVRREPSVAHRVFVVDDDRSNRELLSSLLRMIGQSVTVASSGEMAIRMVLDQRPEVVFLDLILLGMNGCEVARQLRSYPELDDLVLIALSGNGDDESRKCAGEAGFDKYLVKPIGVAVLIETLNCLPAANRACQPDELLRR